MAVHAAPFYAKPPTLFQNLNNIPIKIDNNDYGCSSVYSADPSGLH